MEQKKFDLSSMIGFALIFGILLWIMYQNQPSEAEIKAEKAKKGQIEKAKKANESKVAKADEIAADTTATDSSKLAALKGTLGSFAYSATLPSATNATTTLENDLVKLVISNKGGYLKEAILKKYERFQKGSGQLVELVNKNNASLNLQLHTTDNRVLDTKNMYFEPTVTKIGDSQVLTLRLKAGAEQYLEYRYVLKPNDYMLDFDIRSQGLAKVLNTSKPVDLNWDLKTYRNEKSVSYENRYAEIIYEYDGGKDDYLGQGKDKKETVEDVTYAAFKQHFFTSILLTKTPFKSVDFVSDNLVEDEKTDTTFTKQFRMKAPLAFNSAGELDYKMNWYYGPADYKLLDSYDRNLDEIIPLGWGIFGWINKLIFVPLFGFLGSFITYGIAIIIFTLLIKLAMSPITYRSFLSQAKMRVLRPEIAELNEKFSKDPMKRQQETMALYNKAGVNPLAGCIPALIQLPFVYASFQFFPSAIELRQKSFLWANDLSSFDEVAKLPFRIPVYGDHVSLFPIFAAIAIFFYMKMTSGDQAMTQPTQEGMPDMSKVMKIMIYLSPLMMLLFFNNYGSGLSLYNFISNLVTIAIMFVIKRYVVDEQKIHLQIQENKKKPKAQGKFQKRMQELMEQAEAQKAAQKKK
ncbi:membrane protein insertase YidC [Flavobacterium sp. MAH-1]|uniref:Membrane protein insertase YidC n=1 Tax=Flavobacterium agri TaxID=2743471 RepID=A0A7Y8Y5S5_9FLAO|nr:membrane protein insertase YidC [Flavobacterium agri]NUY82424.1 membrane protein insertase YidC [Flavobacterium agri]NYA72448.1 membrane protein insertase YidC [Flavobacterium agri]